MLVDICHVAVRWKLTMLENIQRGDICIFQNGEEATVIDFNPGYCGSDTIRLYFNKKSWEAALTSLYGTTISEVNG